MTQRPRPIAAALFQVFIFSGYACSRVSPGLGFNGHSFVLRFQVCCLLFCFVFVFLLRRARTSSLFLSFLDILLFGLGGALADPEPDPDVDLESVAVVVSVEPPERFGSVEENASRRLHALST